MSSALSGVDGATNAGAHVGHGFQSRLQSPEKSAKLELTSWAHPLSPGQG